MTCHEILHDLQSLGNENTKRIFINHGAKEPVYGVKVEDLKKLQRRIKKNYALSLELYDSGVSDARYLAGLIADETKMTKKDLQHWADGANWYMISEYTVPWIAAESNYGWELALSWIDADNEQKQIAGWSTLSNLASIKADIALDLDKFGSLLKRVQKEIHDAANRTRYAMNNFIICTGCYIPSLTADAMAAANAIGTVTVNMDGTACKVPSAPAYIQKVIDRGVIGKKKKQARC